MVMDTLLQTLCFIIFPCFLYFIFRSYQTPHGFRHYPLFGTLPDFVLNRHRFLDWTTAVLASTPTNTSVFRRPGNVHGVLTANPLLVEHMLKSNFENYPKGPKFRTLLQDFLGVGIFNSDGEMWKVQRKTASYEFNTKSLRSFVMENVFLEVETRLVLVLENAVKTERVLDLQDVLERFSFDNVCKVAFNVDPGCLGLGEDDRTSTTTTSTVVGAEFMQAFEDAANLSSGRFMYVVPNLYIIKKFFNLGSEKKLKKSIAIVHEFAEKIIRMRMQEKSDKKDEDLLSRFIENGENSAEFLRDMVISFILAGRDTTSSALSWFFWLLSTRPNIKNKILKELGVIREQTRKSTGEIFTLDELREMHYLHASLSEAMRLYPPVPVDTKACKETDTLPDGTVIHKDWFISYMTYSMGRMENIWGKDCREYKPERWIDIDGIYKPENPFKFPVFHGGPRMCLGKEMAYIQMKSIAASLLERFEIDVLLENGRCPEYIMSLTLRMKGGLPIRVRHRIMQD